jgi:RES domain
MDKEFDDKEADFVIDLLNQAKNTSSIESYVYIKNILDNILIPLPVRQIPKGTRLARSRGHLNGERLFEKVSDLSYRTDIQNIKTFGRANEPGQSMFYCSDNHKIAFIETSQITRENIAKDFELMTTSVWVADKDLLAVNIISNDEIRGQNQHLDLMSKDFEQIIEKEGTEKAKVVHKVLHFLSKEFTRKANGDPNAYKISCAFTNYVFNNLPLIDGILFPSTLYTTEGINFVFKPNSVDDKLKFYAARRSKMEKTGLTDYYETETLDSEIHNGDEKEIKWRK